MYAAGWRKIESDTKCMPNVRSAFCDHNNQDTECMSELILLDTHCTLDTPCTENAANLNCKLCGIPLIKLCKNGAKNILKARSIE